MISGEDTKTPQVSVAEYEALFFWGGKRKN